MTTNTLTDSFDQSWACLLAGASPGKSRFSMIQIATIGLDGAPRARTVVIRHTDQATRQIAFHTDLRSPKIAELKADPRFSVIGYDMEAGQQVRVSGTATIHNQDSVALAAWSASRAESRICYRGDFAPGDAVSEPTTADATEAAKSTDDVQLGFDRFCRVALTIDEIDWLDLAASGHRRTRHVWTGDRWDGAWLAP